MLISVSCLLLCDTSVSSVFLIIRTTLEIAQKLSSRTMWWPSTSCWRRCWTMAFHLQQNQMSSKRWSGLLPFYDLLSTHSQVSRDQCHQYYLVNYVKPFCVCFLKFILLYISGGSNVGETLPTGQLSNVPWRRAGVKYTNNEAYFDVVEEIDVILDKSGTGNCSLFITKCKFWLFSSTWLFCLLYMPYLGTTVCAEIQGVIEACVRLTGMPDLTLSFMVGLFRPCTETRCYYVQP